MTNKCKAFGNIEVGINIISRKSSEPSDFGLNIRSWRAKKAEDRKGIVCVLSS
ncbi:MAG: hypothetical protein ACUVTL_03305 [Thermoproteota archaeon]